MNLRLISGRFGGRTLDAPDGMTTHPMGERIRGALFNILGDHVQSVRVLDAFAGTGSLGLEALSRGAAHATFVERDRLAFDILKKNAHALGVHDDVTLTKASLGAWLKTYAGAPFDLIFADPPYNLPQDTLVAGLAPLLAPGGTLVLSRATRHDPVLPGLTLSDSRDYGDATLDFYHVNTL